jgi:hypothetical protein
MLKMIGLACTSVLLLSFTGAQVSRFSGYKVVEAYEIRPGILMMPRYSDNGQVCEIGLERRHYSPEQIRLYSSLSRKEIDQLFEELVPVNERGRRSKDFGGNLITQSGHSITTNMDFENVSIQIFGQELRASSPGEIAEDDIVATVHWKNRKCQ